MNATVVSIEYDPNRTAFIALVQYADGEKRYIIAPQGLQVGATVASGDNVVCDHHPCNALHDDLGSYVLQFSFEALTNSSLVC